MENSKTRLLTVLWEVLTSHHMLVRTHGFSFFLMSQAPLENSSRSCNSRFLEVLWKLSPALLTAMLRYAVTIRGIEAPRWIHFQNGFESFSESSVYSLQRNLPSTATQPLVFRRALLWQNQHAKWLNGTGVRSQQGMAANICVVPRLNSTPITSLELHHGPQ